MDFILVILLEFKLMDERLFIDVVMGFVLFEVVY